MQQAPRGIRLVIAIVGRRNVGKSSLINAIAGQEISIVSDTPGTTTDPVAKHYELLPLGPVTFFDTAGMDDEGELGALRVQSSRKVLRRADCCVLVLGEQGMGAHECELIAHVQELQLPTLVVANKSDRHGPNPSDIDYCRQKGLTFLAVSAHTGVGIDELKASLVHLFPPEFTQPQLLVGDLVKEGELVLCVVPIDKAAPKGRLILPQVQVLRDILDHGALGMVVKDRELEAALAMLRQPPALVVPDSQVVLPVAQILPEAVPLTTFSTLFARSKGDLETLVDGAAAIDTLRDGDRILVAEACSHHPVADDIGRVKIPRWFAQYTRRDLDFVFYAGHDFPHDLESYALVVHCGACMLNRTEALRRIRECRRSGVPVTNYGVVISKLQGVLERVLRPFSNIHA